MTKDKSYIPRYAGRQPTLHMMIGIPGSGKSELAKQIQKNYLDRGEELNIYSSDALREELFGDVNDQSHNQELFTELERRAIDDLRNGKSVVCDATNIKKRKRIAFLQKLKKIPCNKIAHAMVVPYDVCISRNSARQRTIPEAVIRRMYLNWEPPHFHEGFDEVLIHVNLESKLRSIEELFSDLNKIDQCNKHHTLSIGEHCHKAYEYASEEFKNREPLHLATLFHDTGKEFTRSPYNTKGEIDGDYHYYQHHCVGAYDVFFYLLNDDFSTSEVLYISNLIFFHMRPFTWKHSEKSKQKDRKMMGEEMFQDLMRLHEADLYAH